MHIVHPPALVCRSRTGELYNHLHPVVGSGVPIWSNPAEDRTHGHQDLLPGQGCMVASEGESCTSGPGSFLALCSSVIFSPHALLGWLGIKPLLQQEPFAEATRIFHQWSTCLRARCPPRVCEPEDVKVASGKVHKLNAAACGQGAELGHSGTQDVLGAAVGMELAAVLHGGASWEL